MYFNIDRYQYSNQRKNRRRRTRLAATLAVLLVLGAGGVLFFSGALTPRARASVEQDMDLATLWNQGLYSEVASVARQRLVSDPSDAEALLFLGFSSYYQAYYEKTLEERIPLLEESIVALRRVRLLPDVPMTAEVYAVLGQAYYYKGSFYYDLAVRYLEQALAAGSRPMYRSAMASSPDTVTNHSSVTVSPL